jgi:hypothetical protein
MSNSPTKIRCGCRRTIEFGIHAGSVEMRAFQVRLWNFRHGSALCEQRSRTRRAQSTLAWRFIGGRPIDEMPDLVTRMNRESSGSE